LGLASYVLACCFFYAEFISWLVGGFMVFALLCFAAVAYGAMFRRRQWLGEGAASMVSLPGVLCAILSLGSIPSAFDHSLESGLLLLACELGVGLVLYWAWRVNRHWAEDLAAWERCRDRAGEIEASEANLGLRFSIRELFCLTLAVAILAAASRGILSSLNKARDEEEKLHYTIRRR